uniref:Uncharacterized protein n=1 Tax=Plectus sambesii TaxID=2011161 RepID=A0A914UTN2_9BILA
MIEGQRAKEEKESRPADGRMVRRVFLSETTAAAANRPPHIDWSRIGLASVVTLDANEYGRAAVRVRPTVASSVTSDSARPTRARSQRSPDALNGIIVRAGPTNAVERLPLPPSLIRLSPLCSSLLCSSRCCPNFCLSAPSTAAEQTIAAPPRTDAPKRLAAI